MANSQVLIIKQGVDAWNRWRIENPGAGIHLREAQLKEADLHEADLRGANLCDANLNRATLWKANLSSARLSGANLRGANLREAQLKEADLSLADLTRANLRLADLSDANLWQADIREADLSEANLSGADLTYAHLSGADFSEANLSGADLCQADFRETRLREADLSDADFRGADLRGANLSGADLSASRLIGCRLEDSDLTGARIYGASVWDASLANATQQNLIITPLGQPTITVDNLEVAQFIYLLLNNSRIRDVIDSITSKAVLILGRFTEERKRTLDGLRDALRARNYLPIVFDFERPIHRDFTETVSTLAHLSRFVIADLTDPRSIPQELTAIVPRLLSVPIQPLLLGNQREWSMFNDLARYPQVIAPFHYTSDSMLLINLETQIIEPAEQRARELAGK